MTNKERVLWVLLGCLAWVSGVVMCAGFALDLSDIVSPGHVRYIDNAISDRGPFVKDGLPEFPDFGEHYGMMDESYLRWDAECDHKGHCGQIRTIKMRLKLIEKKIGVSYGVIGGAE